MSEGIEFRGMDIEGNWYYGLLAQVHPKYHTQSIPAGVYISNKAGKPFAYHVRPETVSRYIGLKDGNRKVYQGDIYTWCGLTFPITIDDYHGYRFMFGKDQLVRAFIINGEYKGNIHENPELLID